MTEAPTTESRATNLLAHLYIICCEAADFSNGVTYHGLDEGQVKADRFLDEIANFLKGRSAEYDTYASGFPTIDDAPF